MLFDHCFCDVKTQTGAAAVAVSRSVALVKPVKDKLDLILRDLAASIDDVELQPSVDLRHIYSDGTSFFRELHSVVKQVVDCLEKAVMLCLDGLVFRNIQLHLDMLFCKLLLKADDNAAHHLADVKQGAVQFPAAFQAGDGQHTVGHARQPLDLVRDQPQVVFLLFRFDGTV